MRAERRRANLVFAGGYCGCGFCARAARPPRRANSLLSANWVMPARAARRHETGGSGFCARARRARATRRAQSLLCVNWVSPARAAGRLETGGSGFCARTTSLLWANLGIACVRRLRPWDKRIWFLRAAGHSCYRQTGYCLRAPPAGLRRGDLAFARARRATSLLWANQVLPARAACCLEKGGSGFYFHAPRDILVMGEAGIACARRLPPGDGQIWFLRARAAPHPCYGRTGYCPRALTAALRRADLVFALGRPARAAQRTTSLLWANRGLPACAAGQPKTGGFGFCARAPRDILVMGEPGIARARCRPPCDWRI